VCEYFYLIGIELKSSHMYFVGGISFLRYHHVVGRSIGVPFSMQAIAI